VQAALLMTAIKSIIKIMVENDKEGLDLPRLVTRLNERVSQELFISNNYMTLLIGVIDTNTKEFTYLNAGHPPLVLIDTLSGTAQVIDSKGSMPLGWLPKAQYESDELGVIPITEHSIFLLYTDGIYECENDENKEFGMEGLLYILNERLITDNCVSLPYKIKQYMTEYKYRTSSDDYTLFAFQKQKMMLKTESTEHNAEGKAIHYMITLSAALKEVSKTAQSCEKMIQQWTGNSILAAKTELIVDEFLNNIIQHGYGFEDDSAIMIEFLIKEDKLCIKFWDKGIEWNPVEDVYSKENPYDFEHDVYDINGKGVKIIMSMSDKFHRTRYDVLNETSVQIDL
jgi:anti-sigma regulatory factor (Ser/Thr protein kinase)